MKCDEFIALQEIKPKAKPQNGVKTTTWWPVIPMNHFIVPLLHCLIGVGDNILAKFRDTINEYVEYLSPVEVDTRLAVGVMELKIESIQESLAVWKLSTEEKLLVSQDGKIKRAKTVLQKLQVLNGISGVAGTSDDSPNQDFLQELAAFIEEGDDYIGEFGLDDGVEANVDIVEESTAAPTQTAMGMMNDLEIWVFRV